MKFTLVPLFLSALAAAAPAPASNPDIPEAWKRAAQDNLDMVRRTTGFTDTQILNFALTLEHLEDFFYAQGLKTYSEDDFTKEGFGATVRKNVALIGREEATHVDFLTKALGKDAVPACNYKFYYNTVSRFMNIAGILEGVGTSAYLGAAALIMDPSYLTVAASILAVEARHSAYIRANQPQPETGFAQPFDVPLSVREVYTLASLYITSCPKSADLGLTPFPSLTFVSTNARPIEAGTKVTLALQSGTSLPKKAYAAFESVTGPVYAKFTSKGNNVVITIPKGVAGQAYVVLTSNSTSTDDDYILAGPGIVEIDGY